MGWVAHECQRASSSSPKRLVGGAGPAAQAVSAHACNPDNTIKPSEPRDAVTLVVIAPGGGEMVLSSNRFTYGSAPGSREVSTAAPPCGSNFVTRGGTVASAPIVPLGGHRQDVYALQHIRYHLLKRCVARA
jgi:hypothetical protein